MEKSKQNNYKTKTLEILKEKYGEEFAIKQTGGTFGATRNTRKLVCYPVNNPNDSFNVEVKRDLSKVYDEYFNRIMEHQLEELVIPYAKEVFGDEVVVKPYLEGMFYNYSTGMDIKEYLRDNNPPILLYVFIKSNKEELSSEDNANIKLFLEKITEFNFIEEASISFFFTRSEVYNKIEEDIYEQKEKQDIWAFYRDKDKIITGAKFKIIDSKVSVDLEEISNELQRMKELIWQ